MNILGIIPARGGSKRIKGKNTKLFLGKEIIAYPIESMLNVPDITSVLVSTDSENIAELARSHGANVPYLRSAKNADDFATTFDVIEEVLQKEQDHYDLVCCVYPTSVFVSSAMLQSAINKLMSNDDATSIASVIAYGHPIQRSLSKEGEFLSSNYPQHYNTRSQDLAVNYHDAGQFYVCRTASLLQEKRLITQNCIPYVLSENGAQDIDTIDDWQLAEIKYQNLGNRQ